MNTHNLSLSRFASRIRSSATVQSARQLGERFIGLSHSSESDDYSLPHLSQAPTFGIGAMLSGLNWEGMREGVDHDSRARIVIAGAEGVGKSTLIRRLNGLPIEPTRGPSTWAEFVTDAERTPAIEDLGLFCHVRFGLSNNATDRVDWSPEFSASASFTNFSDANSIGNFENAESVCWSHLQSVDLIVWMLDARMGLRPREHNWICRARSLSKPILVVVNERDDQDAASKVDSIGSLQQILGSPVIKINAKTGENVLESLLPRMVAACDKLNTPLGREVPAWRPFAAQRVIARAALLSGLIGAEPVSLLDLPSQIMLQMRSMMNIAAIYGEPQGDRYSRELIAMLLAGAGLRFTTAQIAKTIPFVGWAVSRALAASGSWLMGWTTHNYFANGKRMILPIVTPKLPHIRTSTNFAQESMTHSHDSEDEPSSRKKSDMSK
jgi:uncharacterized protein (DUF697 family)/signal recognition particle receptor subunit beta